MLKQTFCADLGKVGSHLDLRKRIVGKAIGSKPAHRGESSADDHARPRQALLSLWRPERYPANCTVITRIANLFTTGTQMRAQFRGERGRRPEKEGDDLAFHIYACVVVVPAIRRLHTVTNKHDGGFNGGVGIQLAPARDEPFAPLKLRRGAV